MLRYVLSFSFTSIRLLGIYRWVMSSKHFETAIMLDQDDNLAPDAEEHPQEAEELTTRSRTACSVVLSRSVV